MRVAGITGKDYVAGCIALEWVGHSRDHRAARVHNKVIVLRVVRRRPSERQREEPILDRPLDPDNAAIADVGLQGGDYRGVWRIELDRFSVAPVEDHHAVVGEGKAD